MASWEKVHIAWLEANALHGVLHKVQPDFNLMPPANNRKCENGEDMAVWFDVSIKAFLSSSSSDLHGT